MEPFVYEDDAVRISLDDGEWIDIKPRLSYGDIDALTGDEARALQSGRDTTRLLMMSIKAWSLKGRDGELAPITPEFLTRLDLGIATQIVQEVVARNPFVMKISTRQSGRPSSRARAKSR